jgi:modulator of FtsH protease
MAWFGTVTNAPYLGWLSLLIYFGLLFVTQALRNSIWGIVSTFAFTGFMGYTLGPILNFTLQNFANGTQMVMTAGGLTGFIFLGLSGYALVTQKDFSYMGGFLFATSMILMITSILALFVQMPMMSLFVSAGFALIFCGYILFETSALLQGGSTNYILATISLYVSIYNLFVSLLNILMMLSGRSRD